VASGDRRGIRKSGSDRLANDAKACSASSALQWWHFCLEAATLASQNTQAVNFAGVPALAIPVPIFFFQRVLQFLDRFFLRLLRMFARLFQSVFFIMG